jgi:hypothetical protein
MPPFPATALTPLQAHLNQMQPGSVFTRRDLQGLIAPGSLGRILAKLAQDGSILRLGRGLFALPKHNTRLGLDIPPDPEDIAAAVARKRGWTIIPHGAWAANELGLDLQVPAQFVCISDGPSETITIAGKELIFKHARPKDLVADDPEISTIIQALRHVHKHGLDDAIQHLSQRLPRTVCDRLVERTARTSTWLHEAANKIKEAQREHHD